jgi:Ni,Fe-hydrogenase I cytochrome b subunit
MVGFLGWFNVVLAASALLLFFLRRINKYFYQYKHPGLRKTATIISKFHPYIGFTLLFTSLIHGYMALGTVRLHTGSIAWLLLFFLMLTATLGRKYKPKHWIKGHRILAGLFVLSILVHIFARNII